MFKSAKSKTWACNLGLHWPSFPQVAGNAIRSIGHWVTLLACSDSKSETIEKNELLRLVLESLSAKVSNTLEIVSNEKKGSLSWKQRSVAKKHGWGACHSLAQLFQAMKGIDDPALIASCSAAVRKLILCVEHFSSLNEKVAISAMAALREMEPLQFAEVAGKTGLIGEALATCTIQLYEVRWKECANFMSDCYVTTFRSADIFYYYCRFCFRRRRSKK
jgi:hypothetical protein